MLGSTIGISECIFPRNLFVIVIGSPIEEISIKKGLKQGDPLARFLFLLVAEGLSGLMRQEFVRPLFTGISLGEHEPTISHL